MATRVNTLLLGRPARVVVFAACLAPLVWLLSGAVRDTLGANPAEALIRGTGDWTLRLLCVVLAITPLREATGWTGLARHRRMLGVFCFAYGCLHALAYAWLDMGLVPADIVRDIVKRPFILVGTLALLLMLPLALTSLDAAVRALGARRWKALHRAVYAVALLALLHFFWMRAGKNDFAEWSVYATIVALLLGWRVRSVTKWLVNRRAGPAP